MEPKKKDTKRREKKAERRVADERLSTPDQLDQVIRVARFPYWLALGASMLVLLAAVVAAVAIKIPVTVRGDGILINVEGILAVTSSTEGRLAKLFVRLGSTIEAGDLVARLEQPGLEQELSNRRAELTEALERQREIGAFHAQTSRAEEESIARQLETLKQRRVFAEDKKLLLEEELEIEEQLVQEKILSARKPAATRTRVNEAESELLAIANELKRLEQRRIDSELIRKRELLEVRLRVNDLERQVAALEEEYGRASEVRSPYRGRVVELKVNQGEIVERHGALLSLLPTAAAGSDELGGGDAAASKMVAVLYVPPAEGKKIRPGMEVQITPSAVKREEHGYMLGTVEAVAEVPATTEGMMRILHNRQLVDQLSQDHAPFEVLVRLLKDPKTETGYKWSSSAGPSTEINVGTLCSGDVVTDRKLPIEILLPAVGRLFHE